MTAQQPTPIGEQYHIPASTRMDLRAFGAGRINDHTIVLHMHGVDGREVNVPAGIKGVAAVLGAIRAAARLAGPEFEAQVVDLLLTEGRK